MLRDIAELYSKPPEVAKEGNFTIHLSAIIDHAHKQNNALIKGVEGLSH